MVSSLPTSSQTSNLSLYISKFLQRKIEEWLFRDLSKTIPSLVFDRMSWYISIWWYQIQTLLRLLARLQQFALKSQERLTSASRPYGDDNLYDPSFKSKILVSGYIWRLQRSSSHDKSARHTSLSVSLDALCFMRTLTENWIRFLSWMLNMNSSEFSLL